MKVKTSPMTAPTTMLQTMMFLASSGMPPVSVPSRISRIAGSITASVMVRPTTFSTIDDQA